MVLGICTRTVQISNLFGLALDRAVGVDMMWVKDQPSERS